MENKVLENRKIRNQSILGIWNHVLTYKTAFENMFDKSNV